MVTIHVGLGLGELHLVHALAGVPVQEGLSAEHGGELLTDPLEEFLRSNPSWCSRFSVDLALTVIPRVYLIP